MVCCFRLPSSVSNVALRLKKEIFFSHLGARAHIVNVAAISLEALALRVVVFPIAYEVYCQSITARTQPGESLRGYHRILETCLNVLRRDNIFQQRIWNTDYFRISVAVWLGHIDGTSLHQVREAFLATIRPVPIPVVQIRKISPLVWQPPIYRLKGELTVT